MFDQWQAGSVQDHQVPSDYRVSYEEDRGQQHAGIHRGQALQQASDTDGRQEALRHPSSKGQHPHQVNGLTIYFSPLRTALFLLDICSVTENELVYF